MYGNGCGAEAVAVLMRVVRAMLWTWWPGALRVQQLRCPLHCGVLYLLSFPVKVLSWLPFLFLWWSRDPNQLSWGKDFSSHNFKDMIHQWENLGQEPWRKAAYWLAQIASFIRCRTTFPGSAPHTVGWAYTHTHINKPLRKCPHFFLSNLNPLDLLLLSYCYCQNFKD